jgi:hypothetical protein
MLHEIGVDSYYVLVHSDRGVVTSGFPSALNFNHVIIAISLHQGAPDSSLHAVQTEKDLGTLLYFDPTDDLTPFGLLSPPLQGSQGLLVTNSGGKLLGLPQTNPETNSLHRTAHLVLSPTGTLYGTVSEVRSGSLASSSRAQLRPLADPERRKRLERFLQQSLSTFRMMNSTWGGVDDLDDQLQVDYGFAADQYSQVTGNLMLVRPRVVGTNRSDLIEAKDRKYPVEFSGPYVARDSFDIALPTDYEIDELPTPVQLHSFFADYTSEVDCKERVLHYVRTFTVKQTLVPADRMLELKQFFRGVQTDEEAVAVLKRSKGQQ